MILFYCYTGTKSRFGRSVSKPQILSSLVKLNIVYLYKPHHYKIDNTLTFKSSKLHTMHSKLYDIKTRLL